eukprot:1636124-Pleurochrysis_carterae.AAC.1
MVDRCDVGSPPPPRLDLVFPGVAEDVVEIRGAADPPALPAEVVWVHAACRRHPLHQVGGVVRRPRRDAIRRRVTVACYWACRACARRSAPRVRGRPMSRKACYGGLTPPQ